MAQYSIYLDESGTFQPDTGMSFVGGFVWQLQEDHSWTDDLEIMRNVITSGTNKAGFTSCPFSSHSTGNSQLREYIRRNYPEMQKLFPTLRPIIAYADTKNLSLDEFKLEGFYRNTLQMLMREVVQEVLHEDPDARIRFYIPTRQAHVSEDQAEYFRSIGHISSGFHTDNSESFDVNNPISFVDIAKELNVEFTVSTIDYTKRNPMDVTDMEQWGLMFADWTCCWLRTIVVIDSASNSFRTNPYDIKGIISDLNMSGIILPYGKWYQVYFRGYTSSDIIAYFDALCALNHENKNSHAKFWAERFERYSVELSPEKIGEVLNYINKKQYYKAKYAEAQYCYEILDRLVSNVKMCPEILNLKAQIMCCYQHNGEVQKAKDLFDICWNYPWPAPHNRLDILNKYCQTYTDILAFETARNQLDFAVNTFGIVQTWNAPWIGLSSPVEDNNMRILLAKCSSTRGQLAGFLGENEHDHDFLKAIDTFAELGQTGNALISLSHYLHYLLSLDVPDFDKFADYAPRYFSSDKPGASLNNAADIFDVETWKVWLSTIIQNEEQYNNFSLYVCLKGLYKLITSDYGIDNEWIQSIGDFLFSPENTKFLKKIFSDNGIGDSHPSELLYCYLALIAQKTGNREQVKLYRKKLKDISNIHTNIIRLIAQVGLVKLDLADETHFSEHKEAILNTLLSMNDVWDKLTVGDSPSKISVWVQAKEAESMLDLSRLLTYEYT